MRLSTNQSIELLMIEQILKADPIGGKDPAIPRLHRLLLDCLNVTHDTSTLVSTSISDRGIETLQVPDTQIRKRLRFLLSEAETGDLDRVIAVIEEIKSIGIEELR